MVQAPPQLWRSTVVTAPTPATSGTSLVVGTGDGAALTNGDLITAWPDGESPTRANSEILRVNGAPSGDTITVVRHAETWTGSQTRAIAAGWQLAAPITKGALQAVIARLAPDGGALGEVLTKQSAADGDYAWDQSTSTLGGATVAAAPTGIGDGLASTSTTTAAWLRRHRISVRAFGAVLNNSTNDRAAIQAALDEMNSRGGGEVVIDGPGVVGSALTGYSTVDIVGAGHGTGLRKTHAGILLDMSGTGTWPNHLLRAGVHDLYLSGSGSASGTLVRSYYANNLTFDRVRFELNSDRLFDGVELWDSVFNACVFETGGRSDGTGPMVHLRNSVAASGFGNSPDNCNMIRWTDCRFEDYADGALWVERNLGSNNPNGFWIRGTKFETHRVRGPAIYFDDASMYVNIQAELYLGAFNSGFSTPQPAIRINSPYGQNLVGVRGVCAEANSMSAVVESFCSSAGQGVKRVLHGITHQGNNPTVAVVQYVGGGGTGITSALGISSDSGTATLTSGTP